MFIHLLGPSIPQHLLFNGWLDFRVKHLPSNVVPLSQTVQAIKRMTFFCFCFFSPVVDLYISRASHLETLRGLMIPFHGQTSRYGNRAAAGDRKLILELSELMMQPEMCHLNMTKN